jgi:putative peptidoglycan lipid II flippase
MNSTSWVFPIDPTGYWVQVKIANLRISVKASHVARSSLIVAVFFGIDKLLGMVRQIVIGRQFGVSQELDAFNAANNLPDLLFAVISGGALAIAFIPVLSGTMEEKGRKAAWELFSRVTNWAFLITGLISIGILLFANPIVKTEMGVVPGFTPELQDLVVQLMRYNLIATLIFSLSGLVMAGLQANQHFLLPAMAPVLYDAGQIFGAIFLAPEQGYQVLGLTLPAAGLGIHGLVYGVILGAALHLGVQIPGLIHFQFHWSPLLGTKQPELRQVARMMAPRILTIGAFQLIFIIQDNLASRLDIGSVTALAYGWLIMQVPETIIGTAIGTAILPTLSELFTRGEEDQFQDRVERAVRILIALTLPIAILMMIGIRPLVQIAFNFDPTGTELVVWAARAYLIGLVGHSLLEIGARAFYARQNPRIPLLTAGISTAIFILMGILLFRPLKAAGIEQQHCFYHRSSPASDPPFPQISRDLKTKGAFPSYSCWLDNSWLAYLRLPSALALGTSPGNTDRIFGRCSCNDPLHLA